MDLTAMTKNDPFLQQLLTMITGRLDDLGKKVDTNTGLTQQALEEIKTTNAVVGAHEKDIKSLQHAVGKVETKKGKTIDLSPSVMYLVALGAVILLLIIASILHVNLGGLFK